jgi:hypothetical protein
MNVFITTCSKNKIDGGKPYSYYGWRNERRAPLLLVRARILEMMREGELKSGLRLPVAGPDFGGRDEDGQYLPARKRYSEGSFMGGLLASKRKLSEWHRSNQLYFVSAIYGLANYEEPIQNYDLRLQPCLQALWIERGKLANILLQDLRDLKQTCNIIDCCGDEGYSGLIQWELLTGAGHSVRHARKCGELDPGQLRWASGHLAGDGEDRLFDLIQYQECRYTSDNGSLSLSTNLPMTIASQPGVHRTPIAEAIFKQPSPNPTIAIAIHRASQKQSFITHARNRGWPQIADFEFISDLRKDFLLNLDKHGIRTLIIHVDDTHAHLQKAYKANFADLIGDLPSNWEYRKIKNERYSDIELEKRIGFKKQ